MSKKEAAALAFLKLHFHRLMNVNNMKRTRRQGGKKHVARLALESAPVWMHWLAPEELISCSRVCDAFYQRSRCDIYWKRHCDWLLRKFPQLEEFFTAYRRQAAQKRQRHDRVEIERDTFGKPWRKPGGFWAGYMALAKYNVVDMAPAKEPQPVFMRRPDQERRYRRLHLIIGVATLAMSQLTETKQVIKLEMHSYKQDAAPAGNMLYEPATGAPVLYRISVEYWITLRDVRTRDQTRHFIIVDRWDHSNCATVRSMANIIDFFGPWKALLKRGANNPSGPPDSSSPVL